MEGHRKNYIIVSGITIVLIVISFHLRKSEGCYEICLALLGSFCVGALLEFLNYYEAKRTLIIHIIADNNTITNYMNDALWIYRITENPTQKLNLLTELYEKMQGYSIALSRECYVPIIPKGMLFDSVKKNALVVMEISNILLSCHRIIITGREGNKHIKVDSRTIPKGKDINMILDEALLALVNEKAEILMKKEIELCNINKCLVKHLDLMSANKVKSHQETINELFEEIES